MCLKASRQLTNSLQGMIVSSFWGREWISNTINVVFNHILQMLEALGGSLFFQRGFSWVEADRSSPDRICRADRTDVCLSRVCVWVLVAVPVTDLRAKTMESPRLLEHNRSIVVRLKRFYVPGQSRIMPTSFHTCCLGSVEPFFSPSNQWP